MAALRRSLERCSKQPQNSSQLQVGIWGIVAGLDYACEWLISTGTEGRVSSGSPGNQQQWSFGEHKVSVTLGCPGALEFEYVPNSAINLPKLTVRAERGCDRAASSALFPLRSALESPCRAQRCLCSPESSGATGRLRASTAPHHLCPSRCHHPFALLSSFFLNLDFCAVIVERENRHVRPRCPLPEWLPGTSPVV